MVGTGRGAQIGILIRGPEILEQTRRVDTIVLDKTGTVTEGRMELADVVPVDGARRGEILRLAGAVEAASEHPIAQAVVRAARAEVGELPEVQAFRNRARRRRLRRRRRSRRGRRPQRRRHRGELGRRAAREARGAGHGQADERGGDPRAEGARPHAGAPDRRRAGDGRTGRRTRSGSSACSPRSSRRTRWPRSSGCSRTASRGDGRRRRQRRARPGPGRPRPRDRHRHRRRHRGLRPDARLGRPARRRRRDPARAPDAADDQGQPLLGLRLQRRGDPARGRRPAEPDRRGGGDGGVQPLRRHQQPAPAALPERIANHGGTTA